MSETRNTLIYLFIALACLGFPLAALGHMDYCVIVDDEKLCELNFFERLRQSTPNEIGDTLAGFFGSLAFLAAAVAVVMQSFELSAQREEIRLTRLEVTAQRKVAQETNKHLEAQRFESLFFELVSTHNSIVNSIDIRKSKGGEVLRTGRDCFKFFAEQLDPTQAERMYPNEGPDTTREKYMQLYRQHHSDLGHYFRFVHNSMRAISESEFSTKTHRRLFRALFSDDELLIIFYNAVSKHGEGMVPYIEKFELFDNLPEQRLIRKEHKSILSARCFGETP